MKILGIETSFDNTCLGLIEMDEELNWEIIEEKNYTQDHSMFGGVVPNLSIELHLEKLPKMVKNILEKHPDIEIIAATVTPGLIGNLLINEYFSLTLAKYTNKIFIPVNHLEAHILVVNQPFPYLALLLSGAHSYIIAVYDFGKYEVLYKNLDDACGELFDKIGRLLGLDYPYGNNIEKVILESGIRTNEFFPSLLKTKDFSFSGLKTKLINLYRNGTSKENICNLLQNTVIKIVLNKLEKALKETDINSIVACGGVAANYFLREELIKFGVKKNIKIYFPPKNLCVDNGIMIGVAGGYHFFKKSTKIIETSPTNQLF